jgi:hypothetical protein
MTAPIASGWSGCRVGLAPTGKRRLCTAHAITRSQRQELHPAIIRQQVAMTIAIGDGVAVAGFSLSFQVTGAPRRSSVSRSTMATNPKSAKKNKGDQQIPLIEGMRVNTISQSETAKESDASDSDQTRASRSETAQSIERDRRICGSGDARRDSQFLYLLQAEAATPVFLG